MLPLQEAADTFVCAPVYISGYNLRESKMPLPSTPVVQVPAVLRNNQPNHTFAAHSTGFGAYPSYAYHQHHPP